MVELAMDKREIYFNRPDHDTWIIARLHHSVLLQIQDSVSWEKDDIPDIPLSDEQIISFVKGYTPDWDCRYVPYLLGGWFYITRSGFWLKKFKYKKGPDGFYHIIEHYTTEKEKGRNLLMEIICEGRFSPRILDDRLLSLFQDINKQSHQ